MPVSALSNCAVIHMLGQYHINTLFIASCFAKLWLFEKTTWLCLSNWTITLPVTFTWLPLMGVGRGAFRVFVNLIRNPYHSVESYKLIVLPILYVSSIQRIEVVNRMKEVPADSNNIHSSQLLQKPCARTHNSHSIHTLIMWWAQYRRGGLASPKRQRSTMCLHCVRGHQGWILTVHPLKFSLTTG